MNEKWENLAQKFNDLALRQRVLLGLGVLVIIFVAWNFIFYQPLAKKHSALKARLDVASENITRLSAEEQVFAKSLTSDPNAARKREVVRLEQQLDQLDNELEELAVGLIQADKLPQILHDVLFSSGSLKLLGMKTEAVQKLNFSESVAAAEQVGRESPLFDINEEFPEQNEKVVSVFKHAVTISLEGRYFDVVSYLSALEQLPWKIYWEFLDYQVEDYPSARVTLQVYTLSTGEGVLGV